MKILKPDYYDHFRCIAAACPDSCCKEWEVDIDAATADFYRGLPGDLGERLRAVLRDTEEGACMTITEGRCPMWRQDGLCRIQAELGHDALCQTCRDFPRLHHDYGDFMELGLEFSCPEAARLIFASPAPAIAVSECPGGDAPDYDPQDMAILLRSRRAFLDYLHSTDHSPGEALAVLLLYGCEAQNELDGGEPAVLDAASSLETARQFAQDGSMAEIFAFFKGLEILTPAWAERLGGGIANTVWDARIIAFIDYAVRRYWLQAVSDLDLMCRVKFIIIASLLITALGGDLVHTAQQFSKEIENDPDNVEAILDGAYTSPAFTDRKLLGLLLNP